jgi:hypothetical protein
MLSLGAVLNTKMAHFKDTKSIKNFMSSFENGNLISFDSVAISVFHYFWQRWGPCLAI